MKRILQLLVIATVAVGAWFLVFEEIEPIKNLFRVYYSFALVLSLLVVLGTFGISAKWKEIQDAKESTIPHFHRDEKADKETEEEVKKLKNCTAKVFSTPILICLNIPTAIILTWGGYLGIVTMLGICWTCSLVTHILIKGLK